MNSSSSSRNKVIVAGIAGAVGAGALIGLGFLVYNQIEGKKKNDELEKLLARDSEKIATRSNSSCSSRNQKHISQSKKRQDSVCSFATETDSYCTCQNSDEDEVYDDCFSDTFSSDEEKSSEVQLFSDVDDLMKRGDKESLEAFKKLDAVKEKMSENVEFLWRFAKAHQMQAAAWGAKKNLEKKREFIVEGLKYAKRALFLDENSADAHKWFAVLTGMYVDFLSIKEKIESGYEFQKHVQLAIDLKPYDHSLYYLLGRFKFEVANTSWLEKKMAASLFGELPNVTYIDAIKDLLKAERLNSVPWKECRLLLGKCYLMDKDYPSAKQWLNSAKNVPPKTEEDAAIDREIDSIIKQYKNYL